MRLVANILLVLVAIYAALVGGLYAAMRQPPATFARIIARMPMPAMAVFPFETLWMSARAGRLKPGDAAPDFSLRTLEGNARVSLSSFRGRLPVVLIFGSFT